MPIEIIDADGAAAACRSLADGADFVFIDGALASHDTEQIVSAARIARNPPFTVLLAEPTITAESFETDATATKPSRLDEAKRLIERWIRVRLPSRVLVVDDSATMRKIVGKVLAATRFPLEVTEANEGRAALKLAHEVAFDIVLMDYHMPGLSGMVTLAELKREKRRVTVWMMSSTLDESLAERARAEGAAFLKKPFFPADIEAMLCSFYGLRELNPRRA